MRLAFPPLLSLINVVIRGAARNGSICPAAVRKLDGGIPVVVCYAGSDLHTSVGDVDTMIRAGHRDALNLLATARFTKQAGYPEFLRVKLNVAGPFIVMPLWHITSSATEYVPETVTVEPVAAFAMVVPMSAFAIEMPIMAAAAIRPMHFCVSMCLFHFVCCFYFTADFAPLRRTTGQKGKGVARLVRMSDPG